MNVHVYLHKGDRGSDDFPTELRTAVEGVGAGARTHVHLRSFDYVSPATSGQRIERVNELLRNDGLRMNPRAKTLIRLFASFVG